MNAALVKQILIRKIAILLFCTGVFVVNASAQKIQPTWELKAENYKVPDWFQDGKIGEYRNNRLSDLKYPDSKKYI